MKIDTNTQTFPGQVKYTDLNRGAISWKSGQLVFTKENGSWKLEMKYDCSNGRPVLSLALNESKINRVVCRETGFFLDYRKGNMGLISVSYRPTHKSLVRSLQSIIDEIKSSKQDALSFSKCEVGTKQPVATPNKSPLWSSTSPNIADAGTTDASPQRFTSVKENKKAERQFEDLTGGDEKENLYIGSLNQGGNKFLQRSAEKSQPFISSQGFYGNKSTPSQPLHNSTPKPAWLNASKRGPGLMPDPTPQKRARLSDSISYSMKAKPSPQSNPKQAQTLQGFSNLGNTCYMNSILQSLFGLDTFSNDLMANKKLLKALPPQSLFNALVKLLHVKRVQTSADLTRRECLKRVKSAISNSAKRFLGYGQHDAHEFLGQVLDQLKEEVIKVNKSTPSPNKEPTDTVTSPDMSGITANPIITNFEFEVVHTLTCLNCGECMMKAEQFHDISLDIPKHKDRFTPRSLQDALGLFFKNEEIEYACEKCNHTKSYVTHKISRLPRIFILHLKRYLYNQTFAKNTKMGQNVAIPQYVTLQNHCTEQTQPAFPAHHQDTGASEQKSSSDLDDSKEDAPSRRKLEYPGFKFTKTGLSSVGKQDDTDDEKSDKRDEVDSMQPKPLTLEDEEDPDFARAIEMSLKEHEEKDKMARDFGEDTEVNFERVMELSRRENDNDMDDIKSKDLKDLSEEEMIQLAIEQSLRDTNASLVQTEDRHIYTQIDDVKKNRHHNYTQCDDVTEKGHHNYSRGTNDTSHSTSVSQYSDSFDIEPDRDNQQTNLTFCRTYNKKKMGVKKDNFDDLCLETMPEESVQSVKTEKLNADNGDDIEPDRDNQQTNLTYCKTYSKKKEVEVKKENFDDDLCLETMSEESVPSVETDQINADNGDKFQGEGSLESADEEIGPGLETAIEENKANELSESSGKGTVYEVFKKQNGNIEYDKSNNCIDNVECVDLTTNSGSEAEATELEKNYDQSASDCDNDTSNNAESDQFCEIVDVKCDKKTPLERKCQLTNKGNNSEKPMLAKKGGNPSKKEDNFGFDYDEDDLWMLNIDDKENTLPSTEKPQLSSPAEFNKDVAMTEADEVDAYVEESLDLPEIKNEKGDLPYSYRLVSIVNHMGLSTSTGHYLSDVYDMKKKSWFSFDDSHVSKISQDDVIARRERSGYIFFYMSKDVFDDVTLQNDLISTNRTESST